MASGQVIPTYFTNCTIFTMTEVGVIDSATIGFSDGMIDYIGPAKTSYDSLARVIDLSGKIITPGFIDLHHMSGDVGDKVTQSYDMVVADHFRLSHAEVQTLLSGGVTTVAFRPSADSLFGGYSALVQILPDSLGGPVTLNDSLDYQISLLGENWRNPVATEREPFRDMERMYRLREAVRQLDNPAYAGIDFSPLDARETVVKAAQQKIPFYFLVDDRMLFHTVRGLMEGRGLRYYFGEGRGLIEYLESLDTRDFNHFAGIIFGPSTYCYDAATDRFYSMPSELVEYGLDFVISSFAPVNPPESLLNQARQLLQYGISDQEALASITAVPAQHITRSNQFGTLQTGADATLLVLDGTPMDMTSHLEMTIVKGQRVWQK